MKKFTVEIREIHYSIYEVEADDMEKAKEIALSGDAEIVSVRLSHIDEDHEMGVWAKEIVKEGA